VFVELLPGVEGLCHRSEIAEDSGSARRGGKTASADEPALPLGEELEFKIIKMNEAQKRIGLSVKAISEEDEQNRLLDYKRQAVVATSTVGDVIKQHQSDDKT
jgi:small subunit ribosomal protein S1